MPQCPSCGNAISVDFGFAQCSKCGASLVVEFDGSVQLGDTQEDSPNPPEGFVMADSAEASSDMPEAPPQHPMWQTTREQTDPDLATGERENFVEGEAFANLDGSGGGGTFANVAAEPMAIPQVESRTADLGEIADYGNSEVSQGREGIYLFNIKLEDIDTAELRQHVYEALVDARFLWDAEATIRQIKNGFVEIKGINAVKAAILIKRIKGLPIKIRWEQYAIQQ